MMVMPLIYVLILVFSFMHQGEFSNITDLCSLLPSFRKSFIINANLKESLKALALAISCQEPVLLEGPPGCGKTSIIEEFGRLTGNSGK
jgi:MoxR-like ATPase